MLINSVDQTPHTRYSLINKFVGSGSWNAVKNRSIYPVKRYGLIFSNNSIGIKAIAVPIKTILIVTIIGVTLFLEKVDSIKHKELTVSINMFESQKHKANLHITSLGSKTKRPSWKTTRSPFPRMILLIKRV